MSQEVCEKATDAEGKRDNRDNGGLPQRKTTAKRFIFTPKDMQHFDNSPVRRDFFAFVGALGRSIHSNKNSHKESLSYKYDPEKPLIGLSPSMACLHGALRQMEDQWLFDIPALAEGRKRFGNVAFQKWHARFLERCPNIIRSMIHCHKKYHKQEQKDNDSSSNDISPNVVVWTECSQIGCNAAAAAESTAEKVEGDLNEKEDLMIKELCCYLEFAFGHPIRLDYGTGHEASFYIFLFVLAKLGCLGKMNDHHVSTTLPPVALAITSQYLKVTRKLQTDYMLEPAGSHGVWGLDDYHCIPFYLGACQLIDIVENDNNTNANEEYTPASIRDKSSLERFSDTFLYFGCIRFIKSIKINVPFFESSPMLDDISHIKTWAKVSTGLLRLFEGEVLNKLQVVQHFVFGPLFPASWNASEVIRQAPTRMFTNRAMVNDETYVAPLTLNVQATGAGGESNVPPQRNEFQPTKAPWAK